MFALKWFTEELRRSLCKKVMKIKCDVYSNRNFTSLEKDKGVYWLDVWPGACNKKPTTVT